MVLVLPYSKRKFTAWEKHNICSQEQELRVWQRETGMLGLSISCCFYTEILCKAVHRLTLLTWVFPTDFKQRLIENLRFEAKKSAAVELFD